MHAHVGCIQSTCRLCVHTCVGSQVQAGRATTYAGPVNVFTGVEHNTLEQDISAWSEAAVGTSMSDRHRRRRISVLVQSSKSYDAHSMTTQT